MKNPQKYRKKPIVVDAWQFTSFDNGHEICEWATKEGDRLCEFAYSEEEGICHLTIETLEGNHQADLGDYIIKGIAGEFYPCKPDIFEKTYEAV